LPPEKRSELLVSRSNTTSDDSWAMRPTLAAGMSWPTDSQRVHWSMDSAVSRLELTITGIQ
jgi:hypothetical protein